MALLPRSLYIVIPFIFWRDFHGRHFQWQFSFLILIKGDVIDQGSQ